MPNSIQNKIEAKEKSLSELLKGNKFFIDFFQREYRWGDKQMKQLIADLTDTFLKSYSPEHRREDVANYPKYYLGSAVFYVNDDQKRSIIDGQQRITSFTLLLIFLNHLQKGNAVTVDIRDLIFTEKYGTKSFVLSDEYRNDCLDALYNNGEYQRRDNDNETVQNMLERYNDIQEEFPTEIDERALPYFIDWVTDNVVLAAITAYSEDNAYTIFETMNDRGLNLTPTEMLKSFVISRIVDNRKRAEIDGIWKDEMQKLHSVADNADQSFFQAWFRGKYAESIRPGKAGAEDKDFELIASQFHKWFKEKAQNLFKLKTSEDFYKFFKDQMPFYVKQYIKMSKALVEFDINLPHLFYVANLGVASSLREPLVLAAINQDDSDEYIVAKMEYVAKYLEIFAVRRIVNSKKYGQSAIKYTIFNVILRIRSNDIATLKTNLENVLADISESWDEVCRLSLNQQNKNVIKHLLCRITSYVDKLIGQDTSYRSYYSPNGKPYEIEHLWANKFEEHRDEFEQENEFKWWRNLIGALILLPQGTNHSFNSDKYESKLEHYLRENTYAQTLNPQYYEKNPNFLRSNIVSQIGFKPLPHLKKTDIESRISVVRKLCEQIWGTIETESLT
jgi:uncharacterized protein with ParB-like and HNH nuclease domain